jgi:hypothetical protein
MDSTPNEQELANVKAVDEGIRASYSAAAVDDILPVASRDLAAIGVNLPDDVLTAYAQSVADGTDFEFPLV